MFNETLKKIKPSEKDYKDILNIKKEVFNFLKKYDVFLGGSAGKDTFLKGSHDLDFFVYLDNPSNSVDFFNDLKSFFSNVEIKKGSRDYYGCSYGKYQLEFIPVKKISFAEEAENITDVSSLHVDYVKKFNLQDEIRLAKYWLKLNHLYGAESYIGGLSGHVTEILVIHAGSFEKFIELCKGFKSGMVIDPLNYYNPKLIKFHLNESKLTDLVVVDPNDKNRNAAAGLNSKQFKNLIKCAKNFKGEFKDIFNLIEKKYFMINFPLNELNDKIGCKIISRLNGLEKSLLDFGVNNYFWKYDGKNFKVKFQFKKLLRSKSYDLIGPPVSMLDHCNKFRESHENIFIFEGRLFAKINHKHVSLVDVVYDYLGDSFSGYEFSLTA